MTRIGIPEQPAWRHLTAAQNADFEAALTAARAALPETGTMPLQEFYAQIRERAGVIDRWPEFALAHLRAKHEALYAYGVGVSRPQNTAWSSTSTTSCHPPRIAVS